MAVQRIRDPLHDLVEFSTGNQLERWLWKVIETRPFQRLRRIKQLGFSDFVYPGASHSRFAHSIGVFHTARQLMGIVHKYAAPGDSNENCALAAALVHDLGHGPFSHAFESVGKRLGLKLADHEIMSELLIRDSEITKYLNELGSGFANDVADIVKGVGNKTVHSAVVSSQFDADRLDYIRRDRLMTGTQHSAIDFTWLLANLEIAEVKTGIDDKLVGPVETLILGSKSVHAAEAYVLGLFQLYPTVYFHKATRSAEMIFAELLVKTVELVRNGNVDATGLPKNHPLVRFAKEPEKIDVALTLDDTVVSGAFSQMIDASDPLVANFARRLRDRDLYKCVDFRVLVADVIDPKNENSDAIIDQIDKRCFAIREKLTEWANTNSQNIPRVLVDKGERPPYKRDGDERIIIRTDGDRLVDLKERSSVVAALKPFKFDRAYFGGEDSGARDTVQEIINVEIGK